MDSSGTGNPRWKSPDELSRTDGKRVPMMKILGITWDKSVLVSFDPITGTITEKHAWLNPNENFVGLAYDSNRNRLYALSQVSRNLYSIDPLTRDVKLIVS